MDQGLKDVPKDQLLEATDKTLNILFAIDNNLAPRSYPSECDSQHDGVNVSVQYFMS